jgi:signal transduction histidine kinase
VSGGNAKDSESDAQLVGELFPFSISFDGAMRVTAVGARWATFAPTVRVGESFLDHFDIERPTEVRTCDDIRRHTADVFVMVLKSRPDFKLRGQFVAREDTLKFVGGPWITRISDLPRFGLELSDFPPHDPRGDFLVLLQTQESTLADLKSLAARLRATGAKMEAEMKLREQFEAQARQSQKLEAVARLAGGIAHDFNNILMAVQGYVALSLSRIPPGDPVRAWVEEIRKAGDRAADLTRQLLAYSRQQVLRPSALDLAREMREFEKLLRSLIGERIRLTVVCDEGLGFVWADGTAINQIVMNLSLNARDAMPGGGELEIRLRARSDMPNATVDADGFIELSVRDTGIGMDAATRARAFEPFFTTKEVGKGSGLGLAQVYGLVEQCHGAIEVESEPGRGSLFRVLLPRIKSVEPVAPALVQHAAGGRGEPLLLVEDEPLVRKLLEQLLSRAGYQVSSSGDPHDALAIAEREAPFDAVVTDVVMAGMTGPEFAVKLEELRGRVPTIFMSGHTEDEFIRSGSLGTHQRYMPKPFSPADLLAKVRELLDG